MIVLYTDGLSEAANNEGKLFEVEGLVDYLQGHHTLELKEFNHKLLDCVIDYKQDTDFDDDITLLTLRIK
jgi:sigma-B regulation protein RsbU (phosphoserine phosphatase)